MSERDSFLWYDRTDLLPLSLAGQFAVEAGERHPKGLEGAHGVAVVHGEDVLGHAAELHDDVVEVVVVHDLEVLHRGLRHAAVEVEHVALGVVVPHGGLVVHLEDALLALGLVALEEPVGAGDGLEVVALALGVHAGKDDGHAAGALEAEDVGVVDDGGELLALARAILEKEEFSVQERNVMCNGSILR